MKDFTKTAEAAARAGAKQLLAWVGRFQVREKGWADLVTQADWASEEEIRRVVLSDFPSHGFIGEEGGTATTASEYTWVVDPLDGTTNYVHGMPHFAVSVALVQGDNVISGVVFNPATNECFTATRGRGAFLNGRRIQSSPVTQLSDALVAASLPPKVEPNSLEFKEFVAAITHVQAVRRMGSAALNLAYVAAGRLDAYWASTVHSWDIAAGALLVEEAGGAVSHLSDAPFHWTRPQIAVAGTDTLRIELLALLKSAGWSS